MAMAARGVKRLANASGSCMVFVRGFDFGTTSEQLQNHMSSAGNVENMIFIGKGSAEVIYSSVYEADAAVEQLQGTTIYGNSRFIDVIQKGVENGPSKHFKGAGQPKGKGGGGGQSGKAAASGAGCRVFVRGFDFSTTAEQLRTHMSEAGSIQDVAFIDKGSAEVFYTAEYEAAAAAQQLQGTIIRGNSRFIDVIQKDDESPSKPFNAGGQLRDRAGGADQYGQAASGSGCRVFVRGFDFGTTAEQLGDHMSSTGSIQDVAFVDKGSAEVTYSAEYEAAAAIQQLQGTTIHGNSRFIDVRIARGDEVGTTSHFNAGAKSRGKGGGGGGGGRLVFVRGFDFGTTAEQLGNHMQNAGNVESMVFIDKGSAEVTYNFAYEAAAAAQQLQGTTIPGNSRFIDVVQKDDEIVTTTHFNAGGKSRGKGGGGLGVGLDFAQAPQSSFGVKGSGGKGKGGNDEGSDPVGSGRVFVRGFDFKTTAEEFIGHMSQAGVVYKVHWEQRGSATVVYKKKESASKAASELNQSIVDGNSRYIDVILKGSE